ncbi:hypothetical protein EDC18_10283 [Natranaerovirga pectinivora]|uniref:Uncharacterized protein n=1 Tax=Natranaerovirga pectinivora TaxID=682400 RepID=A0A4V2V0G8_9FIRM|nr:hypothetical protein [Natranaerovirga pectinivora]TCT16067.1 hypothetical protein EDC18_10283 [Natranaerovirga pectinivora]
MNYFMNFIGNIIDISNFWTEDERHSGCYKIISVQDGFDSIVNFVVTPQTYFTNREQLIEGDLVIGFYDPNVPLPLIYPPQLEAVVMSKAPNYYNIKVDFFDNQLLSGDGSLKLNIGPITEILLENGQTFTGDLRNRYLIVTYGPTTRSIPPQTTPYEVIVMCR